MRSRFQPKAFTLVELMIAMALAVILMGATVFIFASSQKIMAKMDAKVSVYQYARSAFDMVERDLVNSAKTSDMEFFQDAPTKGLPGHFDVGPGGSEAIPVRDFGQKAHQLFSGEPYVYAMTLNQPPPYKDFAGKPHRHDSIYFRTVASVGGQTKPVLVEYALDYKKRNGQLRRLPRLVRRTWMVTSINTTGLGGVPKLTLNEGDDPALGKNEPIEMEVCLYVTDVKFEFYLADRRTAKPGRFFTAKEAVEGDKVGFERIKYVNFSRDGGHKIACFYDQRRSPSERLSGSLAASDYGSWFENKGLMITRDSFRFPMVSPGDRIFVFGSDDKSFKSRDLTVKTVEKVPGVANSWGLSFVEKIPALSGSKPPRFRYRVGWLPPMVRMVIKVKDERADAVRTVTRQFKLLGA